MDVGQLKHPLIQAKSRSMKKIKEIKRPPLLGEIGKNVLSKIFATDSKLVKTNFMGPRRSYSV